MAGCYTDDLKNEKKLMMICYSCQELQEKLKIFGTIIFKNSTLTP